MLLNEIFQKYISGLEIENFEDTKEFYKIAKAMIMPKGGNFVKGIKEVIRFKLIKIKLSWLKYISKSIWW